MSGSFSLHVEDGVAVVTFAQPGSRVNTLTPAVLRDVGELLEMLEADAQVKAAVLMSGKQDSFVVGADLRAFADFGSRQEVLALLREGHALLARLEHLNKPVVAAVHGPCMGGGLELVLACRYRLASEHPRTSFALPEVKLGLLPGLGGTQRLPRRIGLRQALELMLTGKTVYARAARRLGLVDALIHPPGLLGAARRAARALAEGKLAPRHPETPLGESLLERTLLRSVVYRKAAEAAERRARGNYPAPARIIEVVRTGMERGVTAGLEAEAAAFAELVFTPEARALRHLFFARSAAEKNPLAAQASAVSRLGVLGAGLMGAGIAQVSVQSGFEVLIKDQSLELAAKGKADVYRELSQRVGKGLNAFERDRLLAKLEPVADYAHFGSVGLTVEAVLEQLELKQQVLREVEAATPEGHVFASNTSSLPIRELAAVAERPAAVLGMHYFSPVPKMPLLEVIKTERTADWALATALEVGLKQGKTVIVVGDSPGFYANRILAPYLNEALLLLREGASVEALDEAMKDAGFPVGPLKLLDEVGLDVGAHVTEVMRPLFQQRGIQLVRLAEGALEAGFKGRKSGKGFYRYEQGKRQGVNPEAYAHFGRSERRSVAKTEIQERLLLAMVNEAVFALQEGVISSPRDGDVGAVFGLGFPPFLGGPFFYLDQHDAAHVLGRLQRLEQQHGPRFGPALLLEQHVAQKRPFHPLAAAPPRGD